LDTTDALLVKRWKSGDAAAVTQICERYTGTLYAVAYAVLGDSSLAEDAVQEAYTRATANFGALDRVERLGPWLVSVARHAALDVARKRRREEPFGSRDATVLRTPHADAVRTELREQLRQAIGRLPEDQREVFALKYIAGLRYAEIAHAVGTTPEAVSQKLWRIRQRLQEELKEFRP
jgi:RNA polymerase sigma-70 factor (ECF subfamily)